MMEDVINPESAPVTSGPGLVPLTVAIGVILVVGYVLDRLFRQLSSGGRTTVADPKIQPETQSTNIAVAGSGKQRGKNQKRRETQQGFQNPWLIGTLKGHTGLVLDMHLSGNGKYLASCAEGMYLERNILRNVLLSRFAWL